MARATENGSGGFAWTREMRARARPRPGPRFTHLAGRPGAPPFTVRKVADVTQFPYSACGKLFFRMGGQPFWGTAFVVGRRGLFTAAHNLLAGEHAATDVEFFLQYEDGRSAGSWTPDPARIHVPPQWQGPDASATFDFATFAPAADLPIESCGTLAFHSSLGLAQRVPAVSIGYPGAPFDGRYMWECQGAGSWSIGLSLMGGSFTSGAGGGPWALSLPEGTFVVGSTAGTPGEDPILTSPPFDDAVHQYIDLVKGP